MTTANERFEAEAPTPRTDDQTIYAQEDDTYTPALYESDVEMVKADFSRQLERELEAAKAILAEIVREYRQTFDGTESYGRIPSEMLERAAKLINK